MDLNNFDSFFIDSKVLESALIQRLLVELPKEKIRIVENSPFEDSIGKLSRSEFDRSKKNRIREKIGG